MQSTHFGPHYFAQKPPCTSQIKSKRMANLLTGVVNPSLLGEGDGGKLNVAAAATGKRQKTGGKTGLPKASNNFDGSGAAKDRSRITRSGATAACNLEAALGADDAGGTPVASVSNANESLMRMTVGIERPKGSKAAADKTKGAPGGKQPPRGASIRSTGTPKGDKAHKAKDSEGDESEGDESSPKVDDGEDNAQAYLEDLLNDMQALQARMDVGGTTAARFAAKAWEVKDWVEDYEATVASTRLEGVRALEAALAPEAAHRTYIAIINDKGKFRVLHGLRCWGGRGANKGKIVEFEGEVNSEYWAPCLYCFEEEDEDLFCLFPLPDVSFGTAVDYYGRVAHCSDFWADLHPDPNNGNWIGRLILVPTQWAPQIWGQRSDERSNW
jgi:hypothetical protein